MTTADDPDGSAVWVTDGTPQGTFRAFVFPSGSYGIKEMTVLGNEIYLAVVEPDFGVEAWQSDGTQAGTRRLTSFASTLSTVSHFVRAGATVFFVADDRITGAELWKTDGTAAGTAQGVDLSPGFGGADPSDLTVLQGTLYFFAGRPGEGRGLWRSDGTAAGTVRVHALRTGADAQPAGLTVAGGELFFTADDGVHGRELWKSDGTTAGTAQVKDLQPGAASSRPANLTAAAGRLYFTADDGIHGAELWQSDGTAAGTRQVQDIAPGPAPSSPDQLTVAGDRLYFTADDGETGRELWVLPLVVGPDGCEADDTLCVAGRRFQVKIDWRDFQGRTGVGHKVSLSNDTGYFWFFSPDNVEVVVKVLDARSLNQAFWVFYGALSSVEYTVTVTDTVTGLSRRYFNPSGQLASVGDTRGFGPLGAREATATVTAKPAAPPAVSARTDPAAATGGCVRGPRQLCLQGGRFAVTAAWKDFSGHTGTGTAVSLSGDTGYFWFFAQTNVEVILKVLDGRALTGKFWVFYGALSNVEYTLTVTDTETGAVKTYKNPSGQFGSVADTGAF